MTAITGGAMRHLDSTALVALVRELAVVGRDVAGQPRVKMVNMNTMEEP